MSDSWRGKHSSRKHGGKFDRFRNTKKPSLVSIKGSTLFIKGIPRDLPSHQFASEHLNICEYKPTSLQYYFNEEGIFSGLAMVDYLDEDAAATVKEQLTGTKIGENYLTIEYKRVRIEETEEYKELYSQLSLFKRSDEEEVIMENSYTPFQRKQIHQIAEKLNLHHVSKPHGNSISVLISKTGEYEYKKKEKDSASRKKVSIKPVRDPFGPDGTPGFSKEFQEKRRNELKSRGIILGIVVTDGEGNPVDLTATSQTDET